MKYRKLRIAWSVGCGLLCLLLIALWVRSYWASDNVSWVYSTPRGIAATVFAGQIQISKYLYAGANRVEWRLNRSTEESPVMWKLGLGYGPGSVVLPLWLLAILTGVLSLAPWFSLKRFSLRALLIATALVAVVLGLVAWAAK
jgi:hypothetical protein